MEMSPRKCFQFLSHPVFILQVHGWSKKYLLAEKMNLAIISILFVVFTMTEFVAFSGGAPVEGSQTTSKSKRHLWNFVVFAFMRTYRFFAPTYGQAGVTYRFPSDHRSQAPSNGVSTWMGDHPGTPRAVGNTWCTRHMAKPRPQVGRVCWSHIQNTPQFTTTKWDWSLDLRKKNFISTCEVFSCRLPRAGFRKWAIHQKWKHRCLYLYWNLGRPIVGRERNFPSVVPWAAMAPWACAVRVGQTAANCKTLHAQASAALARVQPSLSFAAAKCKIQKHSSLRLVCTWNALPRVRAGHRGLREESFALWSWSWRLFLSQKKRAIKSWLNQLQNFLAFQFYKESLQIFNLFFLLLSASKWECYSTGVLVRETFLDVIVGCWRSGKRTPLNSLAHGDLIHNTPLTGPDAQFIVS